MPAPRRSFAIAAAMVTVVTGALLFGAQDARGQKPRFACAAAPPHCPTGYQCVSGECVAGTPRCTSDQECSDGVFCNGVERCAPKERGADARGCVRPAAPACPATQRCDEARRQCAVACVDRDGDGHYAIGSCGGDDCDDNDRNRYPGNAEVCDPQHHDEDCNPATVGTKDTDGDGLVDAQCCNAGPTWTCGPDCDDTNPAIGRGSQACLPDGRVQVCGFNPRRGHNAWKDPEACPGGGRCAPQPNGTGVCLPGK
jgi:hypothetical protein